MLRIQKTLGMRAFAFCHVSCNIALLPIFLDTQALPAPRAIIVAIFVIIPLSSANVLSDWVTIGWLEDHVMDGKVVD